MGAVSEWSKTLPWVDGGPLMVASKPRAASLFPLVSKQLALDCCKPKVVLKDGRFCTLCSLGYAPYHSIWSEQPCRINSVSQWRPQETQHNTTLQRCVWSAHRRHKNWHHLPWLCKSIWQSQPSYTNWKNIKTQNKREINRMDKKLPI